MRDTLRNTKGARKAAAGDTFSTRDPRREIRRRLDALALREGMSRSAVYREVLRRGLAAVESEPAGTLAAAYSGRRG
jgi:plasmid stability protein